jgi:endonuclease YncB( thermonuclease family)
MFKKRFLFLLFLVCLAGQLPARTWLDSTGQHTTDASFLECKGGVAYLKRDGGSIIAVPLARLSEADRKYVDTATPPVKTITGKVVSIADGDTLTVLDETKTQHKIRLEGIDCPESGQAYGTQAGKALGEKVFQKDIRVEWRETDKYKRTLGEVFFDGRWINKELVEEGWAWHYKQYSKSEVLAQAEKKAKANNLGLWSDKDPTPPWDFRHKPVAQPAPVATAPPESAPPATDQQDETVYVTKTGSKYHRAGCRYLKSSIPMPLSQAAASYSPCSVCNPPTR